jgi:ribonuclease J
MEKAREVVYDALDAHAGQPGEWAFIKGKIKEVLTRFLYSQTKRRPMVIPVVMEI